jgi:inosine/xanthosine triphosphatase
MLISIGSRSQPKVMGVCRAFSAHPKLWIKNGLEFMTTPPDFALQKSADPKIDPFSEVSKNPLTLPEIIKGATNRATKAYRYALETRKSCDYGVGMESGNFPLEGVGSRWYDVSICAIHDGKKTYIGGSPLFEYPQAAMTRILAGEEAGLMDDFWGRSTKGMEGVIGTLTEDRYPRSQFEEAAVMMALTRLVRGDLYEKK